MKLKLIVLGLSLMVVTANAQYEVIAAKGAPLQTLKGWGIGGSNIFAWDNMWNDPAIQKVVLDSGIFTICKIWIGEYWGEDIEGRYVFKPKKMTDTIGEFLQALSARPTLDYVTQSIDAVDKMKQFVNTGAGYDFDFHPNRIVPMYEDEYSDYVVDSVLACQRAVGRPPRAHVLGFVTWQSGLGVIGSAYPWEQYLRVGQMVRAKLDQAGLQGVALIALTDSVEGSEQLRRKAEVPRGSFPFSATAYVNTGPRNASAKRALSGKPIHDVWMLGEGNMATRNNQETIQAAFDDLYADLVLSRVSFWFWGRAYAERPTGLVLWCHPLTEMPMGTALFNVVRGIPSGSNVVNVNLRLEKLQGTLPSLKALKAFLLEGPQVEVLVLMNRSKAEVTIDIGSIVAGRIFSTIDPIGMVSSLETPSATNRIRMAPDTIRIVRIPK